MLALQTLCWCRVIAKDRSFVDNQSIMLEHDLQNKRKVSGQTGGQNHLHSNQINSPVDDHSGAPRDQSYLESVTEKAKHIFIGDDRDQTSATRGEQSNYTYPDDESYTHHRKTGSDDMNIRTVKPGSNEVYANYTYSSMVDPVIDDHDVAQSEQKVRELSHRKASAEQNKDQTQKEISSDSNSHSHKTGSSLLGKFSNKKDKSGDFDEQSQYKPGEYASQKQGYYDDESYDQSNTGYGVSDRNADIKHRHHGDTSSSKHPSVLDPEANKINASRYDAETDSTTKHSYGGSTAKAAPVSYRNVTEDPSHARDYNPGHANVSGSTYSGRTEGQSSTEVGDYNHSSLNPGQHRYRNSEPSDGEFPDEMRSDSKGKYYDDEVIDDDDNATNTNHSGESQGVISSIKNYLGIGETSESHSHTYHDKTSQHGWVSDTQTADQMPGGIDVNAQPLGNKNRSNVAETGTEDDAQVFSNYSHSRGTANLSAPPKSTTTSATPRFGEYSGKHPECKPSLVAPAGSNTDENYKNAMMHKKHAEQEHTKGNSSRAADIGMSSNMEKSVTVAAIPQTGTHSRVKENSHDVGSDLMPESTPYRMVQNPSNNMYLKSEDPHDLKVKDKHAGKSPNTSGATSYKGAGNTGGQSSNSKFDEFDSSKIHSTGVNKLETRDDFTHQSDFKKADAAYNQGQESRKAYSLGNSTHPEIATSGEKGHTLSNVASKHPNSGSQYLSSKGSDESAYHQQNHSMKNTAGASLNTDASDSSHTGYNKSHGSDPKYIDTSKTDAGKYSNSTSDNGITKSGYYAGTSPAKPTATSYHDYADDALPSLPRSPKQERHQEQGSTTKQNKYSRDNQGRAMSGDESKPSRRHSSGKDESLGEKIKHVFTKDKKSKDHYGDKDNTKGFNERGTVYGEIPVSHTHMRSGLDTGLHAGGAEINEGINTYNSGNSAHYGEHNSNKNPGGVHEQPNFDDAGRSGYGAAELEEAERRGGYTESSGYAHGKPRLSQAGYQNAHLSGHKHGDSELQNADRPAYDDYENTRGYNREDPNFGSREGHKGTGGDRNNELKSDDIKKLKTKDYRDQSDLEDYAIQDTRDAPVRRKKSIIETVKDKVLK